MRKPHVGKVLLAALLAVMAVLMFRPIREESAAFDEPQVLSAGYTYLTGRGFWLDPEQPPLAQMWSALPLLFMDVRLSPPARDLLEGRMAPGLVRTWDGRTRTMVGFSPMDRTLGTTGLRGKLKFSDSNSCTTA